METLTQTQENSQSALEKIMDQLKTASQETLEQVRNFFQNGTATEPVAAEVAEETPENELVIESEESPTVAETTEGIDAAVTTEEEELDPSNGIDFGVLTEEIAEGSDVIEEPTTAELQDEISMEDPENFDIEVLAEEAPKADIEIRLDEIYSIRVVANEVVSSIEELQNEVAALRAEVSSSVKSEDLETKVKDLVAAALRERFV